MPICRKCGLETKWTRNPNNKWIPLNPDGSAHWDTCKEAVRKNWTPDEAKAAMAKKPPVVRKGRSIHLWTRQDIPPWDESLGKFRDFTPEEKAAGIICAAG
jgi:hypothetical protein